MISVVDSATGRPIADSATGLLASATFSDSLWHDHYVPDSVLYSAAGPDVYAAAVERPGYQQWLRSGITVSTGSCGRPIPAHITALMQPAP